jgi:oxygen-independent coproporphyrinogen-3 oxidase
MEPDTVRRILDRACRYWTLADDVEVTLEANPTSVERGKFAEFRTAGVNRISVGLQSLRDEDLRRLGRMHSARDGRRAVDLAGELFPRFSADLIYARQHQRIEDWKVELGEALSLGAGHLSLYQLTIEDGTVFGQRHARGQLAGLPSDDLGADLYTLTQDLCERAGLPAYEVSNHARPGEECRHNLVYWTSGDYLGIGPGAHGRVTFGEERHAEISISDPKSWMQTVQKFGSAVTSEPLSRRDRAREHLLMGLRLRSGIDRAAQQALAGFPISDRTVEHLVSLGLLKQDPERLRATPSGMLLLNSVIEALDEH